MAHVSRPLLIALAAVVALFAVWLVALRPQPVGIDSTPLAPTKAIPQAQQAVAVSNAASAKAAAATGSGAQAAAPPRAAAPQATPPAVATPRASSPKAATPAKATKTARAARGDAAVRQAVKHGKVVVLLFWNAKAADDVATRGALRGLDRHHGKVLVRVAPIGDVARYPSVTKNVKIAQSPTTVVIGRKGHTRVISGLTEPRELSQAVGDALAGR